MEQDPRISIAPIDQMRTVEKTHALYHVIYEGNTSFRMVLRQTLRPRQSSQIHIHDFAPELYIVLQGLLQIKTDLALLDVPEGWLAYVPAGVAHGVSNPSIEKVAVSLILLGSEYTKESVRPY